MNKRTALLILALVLVSVVIAFVCLEYNESRSETTGDIKTASFVRGQAAINLTDGFYVFIVSADGDDGIVKELNKTLISMLNELGAECVGAEILQDDELMDRYDAQVLVVDLSERDVSYMPFYATANLTAFSFYSSNGNISWRTKEDPVVMIMAESEEGLWMRSKINKIDSTRGIISLKAYEKHLADEIAKVVINELERHKNIE
uniref:DUF4136 domain-containing protein n=1 Tax=Candidatus Methanophaga sp. ANME-1 ERB7 TaxID=2759913 RepID=A0A7G9ZC88_9EURY|nr:hypothetical protein OIIBKNPK_00008 [Methanosarcinales archaeon ANME-1 ERB7]